MQVCFPSWTLTLSWPMPRPITGTSSNRPQGMRCGGVRSFRSRARHSGPGAAQRCCVASGMASAQYVCAAIRSGRGGLTSRGHGRAGMPRTGPERAEVEGMQSSRVNECFALLVVDHHREIYLYIWRLTHGSSETEDLCQDTFLRAYKGYGKLPEDANMRAWLFKIATNRCQNHFRRLRRHPDVGLHEVLPTVEH